MTSSNASSKARLHRAANPGERWWFALLLVPALLTTVVVMTRGEAIEAELEQSAVEALREAGLAGTEVSMSGRRATVLVPTGEDIEAAVAVTEGVAGIAGVSSTRVAATAAEAKACEGLQTKIDAVADGRGVAFAGSGRAMTGAGRAAVTSIATLLKRCPSAGVTAEGHVDATVIDGSTVSLRRAEVVKEALVAEGIKASRIKVQGFGDTFPLVNKSSAASAAANNRVAVTVGD